MDALQTRLDAAERRASVLEEELRTAVSEAALARDALGICVVRAEAFAEGAEEVDGCSGEAAQVDGVPRSNGASCDEAAAAQREAARLADSLVASEKALEASLAERQRLAKALAAATGGGSKLSAADESNTLGLTARLQASTISFLEDGVRGLKASLEASLQENQELASAASESAAQLHSLTRWVSDEASQAYRHSGSNVLPAASELSPTMAAEGRLRQEVCEMRLQLVARDTEWSSKLMDSESEIEILRKALGRACEKNEHMEMRLAEKSRLALQQHTDVFSPRSR
eukprot:TRINITY_DN35104_c0_g1_i1.p1 TRINITY_DN35104_c0_g1~~TRINITY_DN35104_c0_g1_i1.p1  ORF type:complete len:287 (+),score=61.83 TRINITY_DN35104_c0_g1_i1:101-961(+)